MGKTVQISSRISQDDASWLATASIAGAQTPSDKLRAIIREARQNREGLVDYRGCKQLVSGLVGPANTSVKEWELELNAHSEVVGRLMDWLPDVVGYVVSHGNAIGRGGGDTGKQLDELERGVADRVFRLMESMLQLGITDSCACYDSAAIRRRVKPIRDLVGVISVTEEK